MMPKSEYDPNPQFSIAWQPGERTCRWLLFGIVAVLADCGLQIGGMVLDVHFWDDEGLTPAVAPGFVAILPQAVLLAAWLTLARDVGSRSLWKSAAGFIACAWLGTVIDLATYEALPAWLSLAVSILGGVGILALVVFLFGKWPTFQSTESTTTAAADESGSDDSDGPGCVGQIVLVLVLIGIRIALRNRRQWLAWLPVDVESWAFFELLVVGLLFFVFGFWFAGVKIRLRHKLGRLSAVLGGTEFLVGLLHVIMLAAGFAAIAVMVVNDPEIDEAAMDEQFDIWGQRVVIVSGALHCLWSALTVLFFASVRGRSEYDQPRIPDVT